VEVDEALDLCGGRRVVVFAALFEGHGFEQLADY
jgi:hypothetical protein